MGSKNQGSRDFDETQARNGSADSGQSSSPDTSSSNGSIADSLDAVQPTKSTNNMMQQKNNEEPYKGALSRRQDDEDALTIKNYLEAANSKLGQNNNNNNNNDISESTRVTTPDATELAVSGADTHYVNAPLAKQPLRSALAQNSISNTNRPSDATSPQQYNSYDEQSLKQQQQQSPTTQQQKISGNNFSGLNLNMTASEMRELIARRKKFDPKKAQMNIRQKYEIIQQM